MADILECVSALLWLGLSVWAGVKLRRLNRRMDTILSNLEREIGNGQ